MADCFTDEPTEAIQRAEPLYLGVIGSRTDATQEKIVECVMTPILEELGRVPDKVLLPEEGTSSIWLNDWADSLKIPCTVYQADWYKHQRRAKIFRDARIQEESTHFIIFLNKRSEFNEKLATRLARRGYTVFTVAYSDWAIEQLTCHPASEPEPPSHPRSPPSSQPSARAGRGRTPGTGTGRGSRRSQPSEDPGSQQLRIDPWVA